MKISLKSIPLAISSNPAARPGIPVATYEARAAALIAEAHADWVIVYGDREHCANLVYMCGFDPRFEEAALVLGPGGKRVLIVGNEGLGYTSMSILPVEVALCQSFSLMGQPRASAPRLEGVLRGIGLSSGAVVALVGWKYLEADEIDDPEQPAFVPAFMPVVIKRIIGNAGALRDGTAALMHPVRGLKSHNNAAQIAAFEWSAARVSACVLRAVGAARPGMTEHQVAAAMGYEGDALSCHTMMATAGPDAPVIGLCSPSTRVIAWGDGASTAMGLHGSLCARAGLVRDTVEPVFFEKLVAPYYSAIATWWQTMRIGVAGGAVHDAVLGALAGAAFQPALNPGHLVSIDEWTHTPIRPGSAEAVASGMVFQCDIIPSPTPNGQALNCEDTVAIADPGLRAELRAGYPDLWKRIEQRRALMRDALGITLADEMLPLSTGPGYLAPFWMAHDLVCVAGD